MARYRARLKKDAALKAAVDYSLGAGPPPTPMQAKVLPKGKDLAILLRDRYLVVAEEMTDGQLLNKDYAPALAIGLKAQGLVDGREKAKVKTGNAELAFAIIAMLTGARPLALDDGMTIDGVATEVDDGETD
jgi:hypothetical protein